MPVSRGYMPVLCPLLYGPWTRISLWEIMKFTKGNIDLGCFWFPNFWTFGFQTPPQTSPPKTGVSPTSATLVPHDDYGSVYVSVRFLSRACVPRFVPPSFPCSAFHSPTPAGACAAVRPDPAPPVLPQSQFCASPLGLRHNGADVAWASSLSSARSLCAWIVVGAGVHSSSTAPTHQRRGSANAETTPAGAPAAAADRTQRRDATCEGKNG